VQNKNKSLVFVLQSALCALSFFAAGCSSTALVKLTPIHSDTTLTVNFPRACYVPDESGEDRILLQSSPIDEPPTAGPGQPLPPQSDPPLWQVLVIELNWRTNVAGRRDSLVADNAVLHWYVHGKTDTGVVSWIHYQGSGAVSVDADSKGANVTIHNAELHRVAATGSLRDPLMDFHLNGHFRAVIDPPHAKQINDDLAAALKP
jgi:hypothetical protein